jgi:aminoglycoside phosphotransferase (APT) family kinase protein
MERSDTVPASQDTRRNIMHSIANATIDLLKIRRIGAPALEWMTAKLNRRIARAQAGTYMLSVAACEQQRDLIPRYRIPEFDNAPHILVHGDLSANNIIVGDDNSVSSMIDLGIAEFRPLQFAAEYPWFPTHEPRENKDGSFTWAYHDSEIMQEDRAFYWSCIEARAKNEGGIVADYHAVLARKDEIARFWWFTAAWRRDVHKAMVACE